MTRWRTLPTFIFVLLLSLALVAACGDSTPTTAPAPTTAAPTKAATTAPTTVVPTPAAQTTVATTSAATPAASTTAATTTSAAINSPVELIRKYDNSTAQLKSPMGIALDGQGNLYVADDKLNKVLKYDKDGKLVTSWGGFGTDDGKFHFSNGKNGDAGFLAVDKQGNVYVSDTQNFRVQKFDSSGNFLAKWNIPSSNNASGIGPILIANDNIYIGSIGIQKYDLNGKLLAEWKDDGTLDGKYDLIGPGAVDKQGNLYVVEPTKALVRKLDSNGKSLAIWGSKGEGDGQFTVPLSLALDSKSNVYVGDAVAGRIQIFSPDGKFISQWNSSSDGKPLSNIVGLVIDAQDNIFVSDQGARAIYQFRLRNTGANSATTIVATANTSLVEFVREIDMSAKKFHVEWR